MNANQIYSLFRSLLKIAGGAILTWGGSTAAAAHGLPVAALVQLATGTILTSMGLWLSQKFHSDDPASSDPAATIGVITTVLMLLICAPFLNGCASLTNVTGETPAQQIQTVDTVAQDASRLGAASLLASHPDIRTTLTTVNQVLTDAIGQGTIDPMALQNLINAKVPAADIPLVDAALNAGFSAYQIWITSELPKLTASQGAAAALQIVTAINGGLTAALVTLPIQPNN